MFRPSDTEPAIRELATGIGRLATSVGAGRYEGPQDLAEICESLETNAHTLAVWARGVLHAEREAAAS